MKSFLKAIAKIATIIALLVLLVVVANYFTMGDTTNFWSNTKWFGWVGPKWLTTSFVVVLAIGVLLVAALISPEGFQAGIKTVGNGIRNVVKGFADIAKEGFKGLWDSWGIGLIAAAGGLLVLFGLRNKGESSSLTRVDEDDKKGLSKVDKANSSSDSQNKSDEKLPSPF